MPGWLYLPFNQLSAESDQLIRPERDLLNNQVHLVIGDVQKIDSQNRELHVHHSQGLDEIVGTAGASEATYPYDYLVLATGARLVASDLPGLDGTEGKWHHFYSAEGSLQLRQALQTFEGGRIVVTVGGIPYRCLPAPLEFTFLLDEWLRKRGLRDRTEIHYLYLLPRVFPIETVAEYTAFIGTMPGGWYTVNGKSFPDTQPIMVKHGQRVHVRFIGADVMMMHPMHLHGHTFNLVAQDGHMLPQPVQLDTIAVNPGETYDLTFTAWAAPGSIYPFHCHILSHLMNPGQSGEEMGGLIILVEYAK